MNNVSRDLNSVNPPVNTQQSGLKLAAEREKRGITQAALARRMGVQPARVSAIESGRNKLRPETVLRYMTCLELIEHDQTDAGEFEMKLTTKQVRWLAIFSELSEDEQEEAAMHMRERYADRLTRRFHEHEVRGSDDE